MNFLCEESDFSIKALLSMLFLPEKTQTNGLKSNKSKNAQRVILKKLY
jgi:hypothetical protein